MLLNMSLFLAANENEYFEEHSPRETIARREFGEKRSLLRNHRSSFSGYKSLHSCRSLLKAPANMRDTCLLLITTFASATALVPRDPIPSTVYPPLCSIDPQVCAHPPTHPPRAAAAADLLGTLDRVACYKVLSEAPSSTVFNISDGLHARCISALVPPKAKLPMPILFDFHGAGGNAEHYGAKSDALGKLWISLAATHQFAVIGGESIQWYYALLRAVLCAALYLTLVLGPRTARTVRQLLQAPVRTGAAGSG